MAIYPPKDISPGTATIFKLVIGNAASDFRKLLDVHEAGKLCVSVGADMLASGCGDSEVRLEELIADAQKHLASQAREAFKVMCKLGLK